MNRMREDMFYDCDVNPRFFGLNSDELPDMITSQQHIEAFKKYLKFPEDCRFKNISIGRVRPKGQHFYFLAR